MCDLAEIRPLPVAPGAALFGELDQKIDSREEPFQQAFRSGRPVSGYVFKDLQYLSSCMF